MQLDITINDPADDNTLIDYFAASRGYQALVGGVPNLQTKLDFMKADLQNYLKSQIIVGQNTLNPPPINVTTKP